MRSLSITALLGAALCMMAGGVATADAAPGDWASIAYDPDGKTGFPGPGFAVWVNHAGSQAEAEGAVLGRCVSGPGMGGSSAPCGIVATVQDGCVALVDLAGILLPSAGVGSSTQAALDAASAGHQITDVQYVDCTY